MIHLINRCVFFKIYFLKIIFVDLGIPRWHLLVGTRSRALESPSVTCCTVLCMFTSFGLASPRILFRLVFRFGLYFCVYCTIL